MNINLY